MIDEILADRVMPIQGKGEFQFGADTIDARDENGIEIFFVYGKQAAEPADLAEHAASERLVREILDPLLGSIGAINVDACVGVRDRTSLRVRALGQRVSSVMKVENGWLQLLTQGNVRRRSF